jgi:membrane protein DedA with SNARE-associated domain
MTEEVEVKEERRKFKLKGWHAILLSVILVAAIATIAIIYRRELANLKELGYLGAFIISLMSAATIIVYIPGVPVVFTLGGVLPYPIFVGLAAGFGEAIGELTGYLAGRGGSTYFKQRYAKLYSRIERWIRTKGYLTVFLSSALINPLFDLIGATAGAMRYPIWKFFLLCWAGKTIKGTAVAYLGYFGLGSILRLFDITNLGALQLNI